MIVGNYDPLQVNHLRLTPNLTEASSWMLQTADVFPISKRVQKLPGYSSVLESIRTVRPIWGGIDGTMIETIEQKLFSDYLVALPVADTTKLLPGMA